VFGLNLAETYAVGFALLGTWGVFSGSRSFKPAGPWAARRWQIVLVGNLFVGSCFLCAAALWLGWFRAWMLAPFGLSFLLMIPLPCYFKGVDENRALHLARNLLFVFIAIVSFALALGLIPLALFGL
jgi:hypothetical protein